MSGVTMQLESKTIVIHIPMIFRRRGGRRKVVLPPSSREQAAAAPQEPLLIALARAHRWQDMLDRGVAASLTELADRLKLNRSYVRRILYLALLAPDIAEAIVQGKEPSGLSLEKLSRDIPETWHEQRNRLGFSTSERN